MKQRCRAISFIELYIILASRMVNQREYKNFSEPNLPPIPQYSIPPPYCPQIGPQSYHDALDNGNTSLMENTGLNGGTPTLERENGNGICTL